MAITALLGRFPRWLDGRAVLVGLGLTLWLGVAAARGGYWDAPRSTDLPRVRQVDPRAIEVLDGDTLHLGGEELRFLAVDTPERAAPWFEGDQEPWASLATEEVQRALAAASRVEVHSHGRRDTYGRELVHVVVDGEPLAVRLVRGGFAYPTVRRYGDGGFPALAARVQREALPPRFEKPWVWRRKHRIRSR